jgi:spore coat protein U-like protein
MQVVARIVAKTSVLATPLDFGSFTRESGTVHGQAAITVTVSPGIAYQVAIGAGLHASEAWRHLENAGFLVAYRLFQPSGREWGDRDFENSYPRGRSVAGVGTGFPVTYTVRGELYAASLAPEAPTGAYADVVTVTLYY